MTVGQESRDEYPKSSKHKRELGSDSTFKICNEEAVGGAGKQAVYDALL
jgi:hypothetical protein